MKKNSLRTASEYAVLTLISFIFILPLLFLVIESFRSLSGLFTPLNYAQVLGKERNLHAFSMGLAISTSVSVITVAVALSLSLLLNRRGGGNSEKLLSVILLLGGLPFCTLVIPLYFVLFTVKLLDSIPITVLFLAAANIPPNVWIIKKFIDTIPGEMKETASLDGTPDTAFFLKILLPQLLPVLTGSFISTFINCWGNFIVPFILLSSSDKLPTALSFFQVFSTGDPALYGYLSAYAVLYFIPVIALFFILRLGMPRIFMLQRLKT